MNEEVSSARSCLTVRPIFGIAKARIRARKFKSGPAAVCRYRAGFFFPCSTDHWFIDFLETGNRPSIFDPLSTGWTALRDIACHSRENIPGLPPLKLLSLVRTISRLIVFLSSRRFSSSSFFFFHFVTVGEEVVGRLRCFLQECVRSFHCRVFFCFVLTNCMCYYFIISWFHVVLIVGITFMILTNFSNVWNVSIRKIITTPMNLNWIRISTRTYEFIIP